MSGEKATGACREYEVRARTARPAEVVAHLREGLQARTRLTEARTLLKKARDADVSYPDGKYPLYDDIIARYGDSEDPLVIMVAIDAYFQKKYLGNRYQLLDQLDAVIDRYGGHREEPIVLAVDEAYRDKVRNTDGEAEKLEVMDAWLAWLAAINREDLLASRMVEKVHLLSDNKAKIALCRSVLDRYGDKGGDFQLTKLAALRALADAEENNGEKARLYDRIAQESARMHEEGADRWVLFWGRSAMAAKDKLPGSAGGEEARFDRETGQDRRNEFHAAARLFGNLESRPFKITEAASLYDRAIATYANSDNPLILGQIVGRSMMLKNMYCLTDVGEKLALYDKVIALRERRPDPVVLSVVSEAMRAKAATLPEQSEAVVLCEEALALVAPFKDRDPDAYTKALAGKIHFLEGTPAADPVCDELVAAVVCGPSGQDYVDALLKKAETTTSGEERRIAFDAILLHSAEETGHLMRSPYLEAFFGKIDALADMEDKLALYDALEAEWRFAAADFDDYYDREDHRLDLLRKKAEITGDYSEVAANYDMKIAQSATDEDKLSHNIRKAVDCRDREAAGRIALLLTGRAAQRADMRTIDLLVQALVAEAELAGDDDEKAALFGRALALVRDSEAARHQELGQWRDFTVMAILDTFRDAVKDPARRIAVCDELMAVSAAAARAHDIPECVSYFYGPALWTKMELLRRNGAE